MDASSFADTDLNQSWIRINVKVKSKIRIRIKVKIQELWGLKMEP